MNHSSLHIAICDDEQNIRSLIKSYILEQYNDCFISEYASGEKLLEAFQNASEKPELLFLDIEFPDGENGMDIAKKIRRFDANENASVITAFPIIIFVTGDPSRMPEAFHVHAFQYLVKPIHKHDFHAILKQAIREIDLMHIRDLDEQKTIIVQHGKGTSRIPVREILYYESDGRKLVMHTANQNLSYYGKMTDAEKEMAGSFVRVHRSYLVNPDKIRRYTRTEVELVSGEVIPMSKKQYASFVDAYIKHISERL